MQLRLIDRVQETSDVITFIWQTDEPLTWRAGQFMRYALPHEADDRGIPRWFTIAAPPYELYPRITTRFSSEKSSTFKVALQALPIGGAIEASRPGGDFIVDDLTRPLVLLAGGIGITPFRSILLQLEHDGVPFSAHLLYANRTDEYPFRTELESLKAKHTTFSIEYFTGDQHITREAIEYVAASFARPLYYISGPEPMVIGYQDMLMTAGVPEVDIKTDYFPGYKE
jgi:ferredoxin-NADP reductase